MSCSMKVEILPVLCNSSVSSLWDSSQLHVAYNKFNVEAFHFKVLNHFKKELYFLSEYFSESDLSSGWT